MVQLQDQDWRACGVDLQQAGLGCREQDATGKTEICLRDGSELIVPPWDHLLNLVLIAACFYTL